MNIVCENKNCRCSYPFEHGSIYEMWLFRIMRDGKKCYFCDPKCYFKHTKIKVSDDSKLKYEKNRNKLIQIIDTDPKYKFNRVWFHENIVDTSFEVIDQ